MLIIVQFVHSRCDDCYCVEWNEMLKSCIITACIPHSLVVLLKMIFTVHLRNDALVSVFQTNFKYLIVAYHLYMQW